MSMSDEQAEIYPQLTMALIEATPEWWNKATLELVCSEGMGNGLEHRISNPDYPQDIVVATDEILTATRMLELCSKRHADAWRRCVFQIAEKDGKWSFTAEFER